jgi:hypothetical protein
MQLQLLLRPPSRTPEGREAARAICESLGIHVTAEGAVSLSARVDDERFASLFGCAPDSKLASLTAPPLKIPKELSEFVETISVPPPHIYMGPKTM